MYTGQEGMAAKRKRECIELYMNHHPHAHHSTEISKSLDDFGTLYSLAHAAHKVVYVQINRSTKSKSKSPSSFCIPTVLSRWIPPAGHNSNKVFPLFACNWCSEVQCLWIRSYFYRAIIMVNAHWQTSPCILISKAISASSHNGSQFHKLTNPLCEGVLQRSEC